MKHWFPFKLKNTVLERKKKKRGRQREKEREEGKKRELREGRKKHKGRKERERENKRIDQGVTDKEHGISWEVNNECFNCLGPKEMKPYFLKNPMALTLCFDPLINICSH